MKILVWITYAINTPHFETELEIIQNHLDAGDHVSVVACNANLLSCDVNFEHDIQTCLQCVGRRIHGLTLLSKKVQVLPHIYLYPEQKKEIKPLEDQFLTVPQIKKLKVENFDIGYGVLSSLISWKRDPNIDLVAHKEIANRLFISALGIYRTVQNYLSEHDYDRVYVYNGRYAPMRAILRACQSRKVDCYTHEKASTLSRYGLWENTTIHDLENTTRLIEEAWEMAEDIQRRDELANQFYLDRYQGVSRTWIAFTKDQDLGTLPDDWIHSKINITIFLSSEDEFASIGDSWGSAIYENQSQGIVKIIESTLHDKDIHYYIRVHPNLRNVENVQTKLLNTLRSPNLTVISADSKVSTYALLMKSNKVISFGSTVGIEAVYWGVPSILAGQSFYRHLGGTYNPQSHAELVNLLCADLEPKDKGPALKYGYYWQSYGYDFKYYDTQGIYNGYFKGSVVRPGKIFRVLIKTLMRWPRLHYYLGRVALKKSCADLGVGSL